MSKNLVLEILVGQQSRQEVKMKKTIPTLLFFILFSFSALALEQGQYGFGLYGDSLYGGYSAGSTAETKEIEVLSNQTTVLNTTNSTDTLIEFNVNGNSSGSVTVVKSSLKPINSTDIKSGLGKYITITVAEQVEANLNNSIIRVSYADSEVSGIQESTLRLYRWNGSAWNIFDGTGIGGVDSSNNIVFANTTQFSTWAVFGDSTPASSPSSSGGGGSTGGGGGRLYNGQKDKFDEGSRTETLSYGDAQQFYIDGRLYTLVILNINDKSAKLRITPSYIDFTVDAGGVNQLDINGNGLVDFSAEYNGIKTKYSASFTFSILDENARTGGGPAPIEEKELPKVVVEEETSSPVEEPESEVALIVGFKPQRPKQTIDKTIMAVIVIILIVGILLIVMYQKHKEK